MVLGAESCWKVLMLMIVRLQGGEASPCSSIWFTLCPIATTMKKIPWARVCIAVGMVLSNVIEIVNFLLLDNRLKLRVHPPPCRI